MKIARPIILDAEYSESRPAKHAFRSTMPRTERRPRPTRPMQTPPSRAPSRRQRKAC